MVNLTINNKKISVKEGTTIFDAAKQYNINIPHLCYLEGVHQIGSCRICVVEVEGYKNLQASCMVHVQEGMNVNTNSEKVHTARKLIYELILSDHPRDCLSCFRNQHCEFQKLGEFIQITEFRFEGEKSKNYVDMSSPSIVRDTSKCILCRRCISVCNNIQGVGAINVSKRGFETVIGPPCDLPLNSIDCAFCGQCTLVCPVAALQAKDSNKDVLAALHDKTKRVIVQTAPAIRAALGEEFGYEAGTCVTGKMVSALKDIGFNDVLILILQQILQLLKKGMNSYKE